MNWVQSNGPPKGALTSGTEGRPEHPRPDQGFPPRQHAAPLCVRSGCTPPECGDASCPARSLARPGTRRRPSDPGLETGQTAPDLGCGRPAGCPGGRRQTTKHPSNIKVERREAGGAVGRQGAVLSAKLREAARGGITKSLLRCQVQSVTPTGRPASRGSTGMP